MTRRVEHWLAPRPEALEHLASDSGGLIWIEERDRPRRRNYRPLKRLLVAALTAAAVTAATFALWPESTPIDGPLVARYDNTSYDQIAPAGEPQTVPHTILYNEGDEPAVVERVRLLDVAGPLDLLGVRARLLVPSMNDGLYPRRPGYPPSAYASEPLTKQNMVPPTPKPAPAADPEKALQLLIGVRSRGDAAGYLAVEVTYTVGGQRYREVFHNGVTICSPAEAAAEAEWSGAQGRCPGIDEDEEDYRILG